MNGSHTLRAVYGAPPATQATVLVNFEVTNENTLVDGYAAIHPVISINPADVNGKSSGQPSRWFSVGGAFPTGVDVPFVVPVGQQFTLTAPTTLSKRPGSTAYLIGWRVNGGAVTPGGSTFTTTATALTSIVAVYSEPWFEIGRAHV